MCEKRETSNNKNEIVGSYRRSRNIFSKKVKKMTVVFVKRWTLFRIDFILQI